MIYLDLIPNMLIDRIPDYIRSRFVVRFRYILSHVKI